MKRIAALAFATLAATQAQAKDGPVVAYFAGAPADAVTSIAQLCVAKSIPITVQTATEVQCAQEVSGFGGMLTHLLIGNSYSTTPVATVRFFLIPGRGYTIVQATQWVETQMAFGQVRRTMIDGKKNNERLLASLLGAGASMAPPAPSPTKEAPAPDVPVVAPTATPPQVAPKPTPPVEPERPPLRRSVIRVGRP